MSKNLIFSSLNTLLRIIILSCALSSNLALEVFEAFSCSCYYLTPKCDPFVAHQVILSSLLPIPLFKGFLSWRGSKEIEVTY